jgi:5-methylthioadenosine/S-adenosylhomocysteine deaminase
MVDTLVTGAYIITMDSSRRVIENGGVTIESGKIIDVGTAAELRSAYKVDMEVCTKHGIVLPGLVDGHGHAGHSLLRSLGDHNDTWYDACRVIYSLASTPEFWYADALLLNLERLKFGTTLGMTFLGGGDSVMRVDDSLYGELHAKAAGEVGVRERIAVGPRRPPYPSRYVDWSGSQRRDVDVGFEEQLRTCEKLVSGKPEAGRVDFSVMYPVVNPTEVKKSDAQLGTIREQASAMRSLSRKQGKLFTQDGHSRGTVKFAHEQLGLLGPDAILNHSTDLTDEEMRIVAETGTRISHSPSAVASMMGRCPVTELIDLGATVVLGSDGGAPDRSFDMFRHMFQAGRYHRRHFRDSRVLPPGKILEMATIDGAKAFGLEAELGSLEIGKSADLIVVDGGKPHLYPLNMPVDRVTCFASGNDVDTVMVDGELLMRGGVALRVDEERVLDLAQQEIEAAVGRSGMKGLFDQPEGFWGKSRY